MTEKMIDLTSEEGRFHYCTEHIEKAIHSLAGDGVPAGDILDAMAVIVMSSMVMNGVPREEAITYLGDMFDRAKENEHAAELIHQDEDKVRS